MTIKFSKDHEWVNAADANAAVVGITVHAQDALGDVVFVDLPAVGTTFAQGGQVDKHHITQGVLGVQGDAHHGSVGVGGVDPLVVFGKFDRHGKGS